MSDRENTPLHGLARDGPLWRSVDAGAAVFRPVDDPAARVAGTCLGLLVADRKVSLDTLAADYVPALRPRYGRSSVGVILFP